MGNWKYTKTEKFGRVDETWSKGRYSVNVHKAHPIKGKRWMVTIYRDDNVADLFFNTKKDALEFVMIYKTTPREMWKEVDEYIVK
jgi:hypothetical protein